MKQLINLLILTLAFCAYLATPAHAQVVDANASFIYYDDETESLSPYNGFDVTMGLLGSDGQTVANVPGGKLYIWATAPKSMAPTPHLQLVSRSVPSDLPIHGTQTPGVIICDAGSMNGQRSFKLQFSQTGTYTIKAAYLAPNQVFSSADLIDVESLLLGTDDASRTITIGTTSIHDVGFLLLSPSIAGVELPSITVEPPRGRTVQDKYMPVHKDKTTKTQVTIRLYRRNGTPVGANVPVYVTTSAPLVKLSTNDLKTDSEGATNFSLYGEAGENGFLGIRLAKHEAPVLVPLKPYTYHPERVVVRLGANSMMVDGRSISLDSPAVLKDGRTYIPYRAISEILGATMSYNQAIHTITTKYEDTTITMTIGYDRYAVDGKIGHMDARPYVSENGRTMVPLRFIAEATGYKVRPLLDDKARVDAIEFTHS